MILTFFDYEIPVLKALVNLGGSVKTKDVYPVVEKIMMNKFRKNPGEYGHYKIQTDIIWKNKTQWAREYLKRKGQLDGSVRGIWKITESGKERLRIYNNTGRDPDEGRSTIEGIDASIASKNTNPTKEFDKIEKIQEHETGDVLGVRGIVYEPINEQGVILLFAALCYDLGFRIEGIRTKFPDAILKRKNSKGNFSKCLAEFEFRSSHYQLHNHPTKGCNLIICWGHDWKDSPIEVLELKSIIKDLPEK